MTWRKNISRWTVRGWCVRVFGQAQTWPGSVTEGGGSGQELYASFDPTAQNETSKMKLKAKQEHLV